MNCSWLKNPLRIGWECRSVGLTGGWKLGSNDYGGSGGAGKNGARVTFELTLLTDQ
jgi:hypothetical protein